MAVGLTVFVLGVAVEAIGLVPPIKAVLKIPIPITISGPVGAVLMVIGAILMGMGI